MQFKDVLKLLREEQELSKKDLAVKLKLAPSTISMLELGERQPSVDVLNQIADYFNVDTDYLLGKQSEKRKISFDFLKEKCELECYFGMLSAKNDELDLEFMREYVRANDTTKRLLLYTLRAANKEQH